MTQNHVNQVKNNLMQVRNALISQPFMASVIDEPLKNEALSDSCESSDSNGDEMSFDSTYETLYKECLSLKQEQVE